MADLKELYQEIILDHNKAPRNYGKLDEANRLAEGYNPLCGDHYHIYLKVEDGIIQEAAFDGAGCAISKAAASIMTTLLKGKTEAEADKLFEEYRKMITGETPSPDSRHDLGKLLAFSEVCNYPTRVKCAILAWHTMHAALHEEQSEAVTTE